MIQKTKQIIAIASSVLLLSACSAKQGATIGGTAGAVFGGVLGAGLSKQHVGNGKTTQTALGMGLVFGLVGMMLGAGTGYIVESLQDNDDEMQEMIQSQ